MSHCLVTGGAGFIGSHIVKRLVDEGHTVVVIDNLSTGNLANLDGYQDRIQLIQGDIVDIETLRQATQGVEYIFHLAALTSVAQSVEDPLPTFTVNARATLYLLTVAREQGVKRLIFSSSSAVYGEQTIDRLTEEIHPQPISPYGLSKLIGEQYCQQFSQIFEVPTVCLRYFNVYGPHQALMTNYGAVIPQFITALLHNQRPTIYGTGEQTRDFVYVEDVVTANLAALQLDNSLPTVTLNIAQGEPVTINTVWQTLHELLSTSLEPIYAPWRVGEVRNSVAVINQAQTILSYQPQTKLIDGLRATLEWYQDQTVIAEKSKHMVAH